MATTLCGIAGAVGPADGRGRAVEAQLDLLAHRGPDARGVFGRGLGWIGQTRLSVIDLLTGDPPVTDESGHLGVVLNGEIYNFAALRHGLLGRGHRLATRGDTEVLAHLSQEVQPVEMARLLDGMFAFAVWDAERGRLVLGRDRLGKKPLYYWTRCDRLVFASEIKAVLAHPWVSRDLEPEAIDAYLTFGYVPSPRTFFAGVRSLPPGHVGVLEVGGELHLERYWDLASERGTGRPPGSSRRTTVSGIQRLVTAAVAKRMVADVPMGAFLSGGLDSSSVVAVMSELASGPVATFTIGFDDREGFDERPYARMVARHFRTEHTEFVVQPDTTALIETLVDHHDQPFGDSSALPTYLLAELTRRHVTVALSGDGGDEVFAGYERFAAAVALSWLQRAGPSAGNSLGWAAGHLPPTAFGGRAASLQRLLDRRDLPIHRALLSWVSYVPDEWRDRLRPGASDWGFESFDGLWDATEGNDCLLRLQSLTMASYLLDDLLVKVDRATMAHGLEVRSPLLDTDLVRFALALPPGEKMRGLSQKRALKAAMADRLPPAILQRSKRGFGLPLARWFRTDLRGELEGRIGAPSARIRAHLRREALDALVGEHLAGVADHSHALWALLTLEVFLQREKW